MSTETKKDYSLTAPLCQHSGPPAQRSQALLSLHCAGQLHWNPDCFLPAWTAETWQPHTLNVKSNHLYLQNSHFVKVHVSSLYGTKIRTNVTNQHYMTLKFNNIYLTSYWKVTRGCLSCSSMSRVTCQQLPVSSWCDAQEKFNFNFSFAMFSVVIQLAVRFKAFPITFLWYIPNNYNNKSQNV